MQTKAESLIARDTTFREEVAQEFSSEAVKSDRQTETLLAALRTFTGELTTLEAKVEDYVASNSTIQLSNFGDLLLGCIDSYDSEKRRILEHFSRSTRFAFLRTAQISNFQQKSRYNLVIILKNYSFKISLFLN